MTATRRLNAPIKTFYGVISPNEKSRNLSLITADGEKFEIAKNERSRFLYNWIFQSVKVVGRVMRKPHRNSLNVLYFEPDQVPPEWNLTA